MGNFNILKDRQKGIKARLVIGQKNTNWKMIDIGANFNEKLENEMSDMFYYFFILFYFSRNQIFWAVDKIFFYDVNHSPLFYLLV